MEIHHPSVIFSQPAPDPQHTVSYSNQDLLSTEEMLNIVPTADNPVGSSVNPMEDHSDFLNEEEVFEAILDGEQNEAAISPHTPAAAAADVQNQYR